ncbi:hypothetical protein ACFWNZ_37270, partial [Streptomyces rubiginosohelvolus]
FSTFDDLASAICKRLKLDSVHQIAEKYQRGIIAIDNIENINSDEQKKYLPSLNLFLGMFNL